MKLIKSKRMWVTTLLTSGWIIDTLQSAKLIRNGVDDIFIDYLPPHTGIVIAVISIMLMAWTKYHDDKSRAAE